MSRTFSPPLSARDASSVKPAVFFFPDYRATNHYQELFYGSARRHLDVRPGSLDEALTWQVTAGPRSRSTFHLHWTTPILAGCSDLQSALRAKERFLAKLRHYLAAGGNFVWTIHNVLPHDVKFAEAEVALAQDLVALASRVVVHSRSALPLIAQWFAVPEDKVLVLRHGHYLGVYPNDVTREAARARFGYDDSALIFLFIGQLRPYKGLEELLAAFAALRSERGDAQLLIAGRAVHPMKPAQIRRHASMVPGVRLIEGHIPDEELQYYFAAADFAVLPYRNILTSGSALLAGSFGVPCIAPAIGMLPEVIEDGVDGLLYGQGTTGFLLGALRRAASIPRANLQAMKAAARAHVQRFDWESVGAQFNHAVCHGREEPKAHTVDVFGRPVTVSGRMHLLNSGKPDSIVAVVVNYRGSDDVSRLVRSLRAAQTDALDVVVIDNDSPGESASGLMARFPDCTVLRTKSNLGFAGGNNIGISLGLQHGYAWCWLVNPDLEVQQDTACKLIAAAKRFPDRAVVGPVIVYGHRPEVIAFAGSRVSFNGGLTLEYPLIGQPVTEAGRSSLIPTDYVNGACLFAPLAAFRKAGPLPEEYFLYFEETDWCARAVRAGFALHIVGDATVLHHKRSEGTSLAAPYYLYYYLRSAVQFARAYAPRAVKDTVQRLRGGFMAAWAAKIERNAPFYAPVAKALMEAAISDGLAGKTGPMDLDDVVDRQLQAGASTGQPIKGYFDRVTDGVVYAWAWRPGEADPHTTVGIFVDGQPEAEVSADEPRNDLRDARVGDGTHGIRWRAPNRWRDGASHRLHLRCPRTGAPLEGTPVDVVFGLPEFELPPASAAEAMAGEIQGRLDGFSGEVVTGWAYDPANPLSRVTVELVWENRVISRAVANVRRADLQDKGLGDGACGFAVRVPVAVLRTSRAALLLRVAGSAAVLCERQLDVPRTRQVSFADDVTLDRFLRWSWVHVLLPASAGEPFDQTLRRLEALRTSLAERFCERPRGPLVSIVMPVWNRAATVAHAIQSVFDQAWSDWELLIVDDGSTDESCEILQAEIERRGDPRIRFEMLTENRGVSTARNHALAMARGAFVAYLDSDNTWDPSMLQIMVNLLLESPDRDCAYAGQTIWQYLDDGGGTPFSEVLALRSVPYNRSLLENRNYIDLNVFVHRRELFEQLGGFNESMRRLVDWELILRYTARRRPLFVAAPLCSYSLGRADNQVTSVVDFDDNHKLLASSLETLRRTTRMAPPETPAPRRSIDVIVIATEGQAEPGENYWRFLLAAMAGGDVRMIVVSSNPMPIILELREEMDMAGAVEIVCAEDASDCDLLCRALDMRRTGTDLVLMTSCALPAAEWQQSLRAALDALGPHSAVTGRWVHAHDSTAATSVRHYARGQGDMDIMPACLGTSVVDFEPMPGNVAVSISGMPLFFCGLKSDVVPLLRGAARRSTTAEEALQFFCNALRQAGGWPCYSSDLVVYDRSYLD